MANIVRAHLVIEGFRPLLWNAFTLDAIPLQKRERTGVAGNDPEEWKRTVLATAQGQLYLPDTYLFGALRDGAKHTKRGRSSLQPLVAATLQVAPERILLDRFLPAGEELPTDPHQPVYLDVRSVKNPSTRGRNIRYRVAAAPGWQAAFDLSWDLTVVSREQMQAVALDAGQLVGVGDGRHIGQGRFAVKQFEFTAGHNEAR